MSVVDGPPVGDLTRFFKKKQRGKYMNRDLFLDGFVGRIASRFGLLTDFAFEILAVAAVLDMTFDEVMDNVSTLENGSGSHDGGMDGIYIDPDFPGEI
jgi:hypothetical protein